MAIMKRPRRQLLDEQLGTQLGAEPMASTGSGDFGAGARLESPYAQPEPEALPAPPPVGVATTQPASPQASAAKAAAQNNYSDIEGAGGLKTGGYMGSLEGFNTQGWGSGERGSNTHKNTFGKIASRYDPKQAGAAKALMADPDFQAYFPDAKLVEHPNGDLIDFGDGKPVDVLRGAQAGGAGEAWQWGVDAGSPAGAGASGNGADIDRLIAGLSGGAPDPLAAIQAELASLTGGVDQQTLIQQMLANQQA